MKYQSPVLLLSAGLIAVTSPLYAASKGDNNGKPFQELNAIIDSNRALIDANKSDITALQSDVVSIGLEIDTLRSELMLLEARVANNEVGVSALRARMDSVEGDVSTLNSDLGQLRVDHDADMADVDAAIMDAESRIAVLESELHSLSVTLTAQLAALSSEVGDNAMAIDALDLELTSTTAMVLSHMMSIDALQSDVSNLEVRAANHEANIADLQAQIDALDGRLVVVENLAHSHNEGLCFSVTNTSAVDLTGGDWFDACVDAQQAGGTSVRIVLKDASDTVVYDQAGPIVGNWTYNMVTSTSTNSSYLYDVSQHDQLITLANNDTLMIPGKWASNGGCGGDRANGYVILVDPNPTSYSWDQKMLVTTYNKPNQPYARNFSGWSAANEISWNNGVSFNTCSNGGTTGSAFEGTFEVYVY